MNIREVRQRVAEISAAKDDYEVAHSLEDRLHVDVLLAIALGDEPAHLLADEALKTVAIVFARHCA